MNTWTKKNKNINQEGLTGQGMMSGSRWKSELHALSFGALLACAPLSAQTPPDDYDYAGQTSKDLFERELRLREKEKKPNLPAITEQTEPTEEVTGGPTFILRGIRFTKSAHLTQEELQNIVQPALGEEIDYNGLQKILGTINQLYRQKNIYTAVAVFPEQQVSDGVVIIRLVEGSIGEIVFEGNKYTEDGYFREWIDYDNQLASIDIEALEKDILFYNRIHNQRLQAELRAGKAFGLTDIVINVPEPGRDSLELYLDNYGYESSGEAQLSALYQRNQLFRPSDKAMAYGLVSSGLKSFVSSYSTVVGTDGLRLGGSLQFTNATVTSGDFKDLGYTGDTLRLGLEGSYLVYSDADLWVNLVAAISNSSSKNSVTGGDLSDYQTGRYQLGAELSWLGSQWQFSGRQLYSSVNSKEKLQGITRKFNLFNTRLTFIYNFDNPFYALSTVEAQFTSEQALPGAVSFTLGGPSTLRGYQQGVASGDQGWYQQIEVHYNGFSFNEYLFDLYGFYDHGEVESLNPKQTLSSAGVGINVSGNEWFSFDLTVANAMEEVAPDQDNTSLYARITCHCID
ncbi:ShlB/FhaC/HecB family hemolysin secretion/activation protein [Endozoicomonas sp.]|uniref:ShlB/FhaC/HecB family hemolysin secretion/activation protein n=1 Tax=Endozoicomonas sp. TaxID=1892382 RepID=UPI003AF89DE4